MTIEDICVGQGMIHAVIYLSAPPEGPSPWRRSTVSLHFLGPINETLSLHLVYRIDTAASDRKHATLLLSTTIWLLDGKRLTPFDHRAALEMTDLTTSEVVILLKPGEHFHHGKYNKMAITCDHVGLMILELRLLNKNYEPHNYPPGNPGAAEEWNRA